MGIFSRKSEKEKLAEEFRKVWNAAYGAIQLLDGLTLDADGTHEREELQKNSRLINDTFFVIQRWVENKKLDEEEIAELEKILSGEENIILKELQLFSQFMQHAKEVYGEEYKQIKKLYRDKIETVDIELSRLRDIIIRLHKIYMEELSRPVSLEKLEKSFTSVEKIDIGDISGLEDPKNWIILPGRRWGDYSYPTILVNVSLSFMNKNWYQAHEELNKEGCFMLTIRQFVDFLLLLKSGKALDGSGNIMPKRRLSKIYKEIIGIRHFSIGEWLDARFEKTATSWRRNGAEIKKTGGDPYINFNHRIIDRKLLPQNSEPLETCLMEDCYVDLSTANKQGLPTRKSEKQEIYFYCPGSYSSVARFGANSDRAILSCGRIAAFSNAVLGVRKAKFLKK